MNYDLLIRNANVVLEEEVRTACVGVKEGKIVAIFDDAFDAQAKIQVEADGKYLMPGGIDTHSHFFDPGPNYREDFFHGTQAAAMGGYTTVMDMPNTYPPVDDKEHFKLKKAIFADNAHIDYVIWGACLPDNNDEIKCLKELGALAFKSFLSDAGPTYPYSDSMALYEGMQLVQKVGGIYAVHAEDLDIVKQLRKRYQNQPWTPQMHDQARPWYAELSAINKAAFWSRVTGCPLHICHTSIPEGVELINEFRKIGTDITIETCPHYLLCDYEGVEPFGTFASICPPIRSRERVEKLWNYVADGSVNYMGTDHAPYTWEDKHPSNLWDAPGGSPNIDVAIPMILEEGILNRKLSFPLMAAFLSTNAAKRFGIYPQKGAIRVDADADFMLVNMDSPWIYSRKYSFSKTKETGFQYEGRRIRCCIEKTFVRGQTIFSHGRICIKPGFGQLVTQKS